jgi:hypothetical protein
MTKKLRDDTSCLRIRPVTLKHLKAVKDKVKLFNPSVHNNDDVINLLIAEFRLYRVV